jgi:DNA-binding NtrC family response regulator
LSQPFQSLDPSSSSEARPATGVSSSLRLPPQVVVASAPMRQVYARLSRAAQTTVRVLILGETGTGKDVIAHTLHTLSRRSERPFVVVNCGAIPETLLESELFGHERGAFSGAASRKQGPFERAHGGTLFLDEVGELSLGCQASLLRVLETRRVIRVGGDEEIPVDVRLVSATNRDLSREIALGKFRSDFLFRLDTFTVHVPPLRERTDEIEPLARQFLAQAVERWELPPLRLGASAIEWLRSRSWPGNVRQLRNVVERVAVNANSHLLYAADFDASDSECIYDANLVHTPPAPAAESTDLADSTFSSRVREFEMQLIREALEQSRGNQTRAASLLGIPRRTLANKIHAYGLLGPAV